MLYCLRCECERLDNVMGQKYAIEKSKLRNTHNYMSIAFTIRGMKRRETRSCWNKNKFEMNALHFLKCNWVRHGFALSYETSKKSFVNEKHIVKMLMKIFGFNIETKINSLDDTGPKSIFK